MHAIGSVPINPDLPLSNEHCVCSALVLFTSMSSKRLDSLSAYCREGLRLRVQCSCGRTVLLEPAALLKRCQQKGGSHLVAKIVPRMKCGT